MKRMNNIENGNCVRFFHRWCIPAADRISFVCGNKIDAERSGENHAQHVA